MVITIIEFFFQGQYTEEEIFDNNENSQNFEEFLTILGKNQIFSSNSAFSAL